MSDRPHTPRGERPARGRGSSRSSARPSRPPRAARPVRASGRPAAAVDFNSNSNRVFLPILAFAVIAALFVLRLAYLQVIAAPAMASEAENARMSYDWIEPRRGTIYDRNGVVLATSVESTTIYIDPVEVDDADATAQVLVDVLGGQKSDYLEAITAPNTRYAVVKEKADVAVGDALKERVRELSASGGSREGMDFGIRYKTLWKREYPNAQVGGQVIGVCTLETDAENNREYYKGVSGLELYYDDVLSGEAGYTREERSPDGTPIPGGTRDSKAAVDGEDIIISIDIELQQSVEERLTADAKGITANGGSAIVMDGGTGEIYAAASLPLLNPADRTNMEADAPKLKCVTDLFEPGSIFKSVSAMAILEAGTMTPDTELFCPSSIEADDREVKPLSLHGSRRTSASRWPPRTRRWATCRGSGTSTTRSTSTTCTRRRAWTIRARAKPAPSTWGTCFPSTIGARSPPTTSASGRACRSRRCRSPASTERS